MMAKNREPDDTNFNIISSGTTIKGEIDTKGDIRIDGKIIGEVRSNGKIIIGNTGVVEGDIYCVNAEFSGKIQGKAEIAELLALKESAIFKGDIITNKLSIEPGARFSGSCSMEKEVAQPHKTPESNKK